MATISKIIKNQVSKGEKHLAQKVFDNNSLAGAKNEILKKNDVPNQIIYESQENALGITTRFLSAIATTYMTTKYFMKPQDFNKNKNYGNKVPNIPIAIGTISGVITDFSVLYLLEKQGNPFYHIVEQENELGLNPTEFVFQGLIGLLGAYHGYMRENEDLGNAINWGVVSALFPAMIGIAMVEGYAKPIE